MSYVCHEGDSVTRRSFYLTSETTLPSPVAWAGSRSSSLECLVETDRERADRHESERKEANERDEQERKQAHERDEVERKKEHERDEQERRG